MDPDAYQDHAAAFQTSARDLWDHANSRQQRRANARSESKIQRFWSRFVNYIFAVNDHMSGNSLKAPIILFGNGKFGTGKGSRSGNYTYVLLWFYLLFRYSRFLKKYLARFFTVVIVDEYYSSQLCPKCFGQLDMHGTKGVRVKECNNGCKRGAPGTNGRVNGTEKFVVNRDISAPMNFITRVLGIVMFGEVPKPFRRRDGV
jgi:hypothetical protein